VIVRMTADGEVLECVRIDTDPVALSLELAEAGPDPEVALESTYGWYWAADLLQADGANVHLVHPLGLHWDARRVKNDERDPPAERRNAMSGSRTQLRAPPSSGHQW
jgi:transposase